MKFNTTKRFNFETPRFDGYIVQDPSDTSNVAHVKIFNRYNTQDLEKDVNDFLSNNSIIIKNKEFKIVNRGSIVEYIILIYYFK